MKITISRLKCKGNEDRSFTSKIMILKSVNENEKTFTFEDEDKHTTHTLSMQEYNFCSAEGFHEVIRNKTKSDNTITLFHKRNCRHDLKKSVLASENETHYLIEEVIEDINYVYYKVYAKNEFTKKLSVKQIVKRGKCKEKMKKFKEDLKLLKV